MNEKNQLGKTLLHPAANNPESLRMILELYPESERLAAVNQKNDLSGTVLCLAAKKPESLKVILAMVDVTQLLHSDNGGILGTQFEIVRNMVLAKSQKLQYTNEQILAINNTTSCQNLKETLNMISQAMLKTKIMQMGSSQEKPANSSKKLY